jgi:hypothetical protein
MEPLQESRQPQRLYAPSRSALRPPGTPAGTAGGSGGKPDQPWTWDHRWRPAGQDADYAMGGSIPWRGRLILLAVLAFCNLALLLHRHLFENLVILLDFVAAVVLFDLLLRLWQASRRTRMRWTTFPAFLGGRLEGILVARPVLEPIGTVRAILRCVRDQRTVHVTGTGEETSFEPTVLYQQIAELNVAEDRIKQLPVAFTLPADVPGTDLGQEEATYWQVALRIPVVGPDFEAVFLAPVYAPSPALKQPTPEGPSRTATA